MDELVPAWQMMPDLHVDGTINQAKNKARRRWEEQEDARFIVAARVGRVASTPEQAKQDAILAARQIAAECAQRAAQRREQR